jgi:hypothetical protein
MNTRSGRAGVGVLMRMKTSRACAAAVTRKTRSSRALVAGSVIKRKIIGLNRVGGVRLMTGLGGRGTSPTKIGRAVVARGMTNEQLYSQ